MAFPVVEFSRQGYKIRKVFDRDDRVGIHNLDKLGGPGPGGPGPGTTLELLQYFHRNDIT